MKNLTAGKGDPYWYEWTVGLLKVVEMLHPDSTIQSVSFQVAGAKGWDDVVVRYSNGCADYVQVKHSRVGRNITFGDLVATDKEGESLLSSLFAAWKEMNLKAGKAKCILLTNRSAGERVGISDKEVRRPPLIEFVQWLKVELAEGKSLRQCRPAAEWAGAWSEWCSQLRSGKAAQRLDFLKAFEVQTNQEDLKDLPTALLQELTDLFQIRANKAQPLLQALDSALRRWTTDKEEVTAEDAFSAMALDEEIEIEHRAPPPPAPFFTSRQPVLDQVENALKAIDGSPVVFLSAEPGAGKTSLISQLANRRVDRPFEGVICLRYFAFRPITPESPLIPPDADHFVRADRLWFSLLSQVRQGLKGKLRAYQVPLRNDLLPWPEARTHVLRIATRLGKEMSRRFTIIVDGIDHAARAMRYNGSQAKEFFESLPGPDEIGDSPVRLMLAGQPAESYPEYPVWLRTLHPKAQKLGIGKLQADDVRALMKARVSAMPANFEEAAAEEIMAATHGNTLAVVFAVEEYRTCSSLEQLSARLKERQLGDGLQQYYSAIWHHALSSVPNTPVGATAVLASALCLTPERLTGHLMATAFKQLGLTKEQWSLLFAQLGPLVVADPEGYRVLHNDVRVFLQGLLTAEPLASRRQAAGLLADYYLSPDGNRWFAHKAVLRLLRDAGRVAEWAKVFSVDWVLEGAALGIPYSELSEQCAEALQQGTVLRDWDIMQELACATETLWRWEEACEMKAAAPAMQDFKLNPKPLDSEASVRPLTEWSAADLDCLVEDAQSLVAAGELPRARAVLERWLNRLSLADLCRKVPGLSGKAPGEQRQPVIAAESRHTFESLGRVCRATHFHLLQCPKAKSETEKAAEAEYELGWVKASCERGPFNSVKDFFSGYSPRYLASLKTALEGLASREQWTLVRLLLGAAKEACEHLGAESRAEVAWWAIASQASVDHPDFLNVLTMPRFGLPEEGEVSIQTLFSICRSLGWTRFGEDPASFARRVFDACPQRVHRVQGAPQYLLLFRAAATLGQIGSCISRRGAQVAAELFPPRAMAQLATALWDYKANDFSASQYRVYAGEFASDLVVLSFQFSPDHEKALLEAAKPFVENCPVGPNLASLWDLHRRAGDIPRLRSWLNRWLAEDGWLWSEEPSNRDSVAEQLLPLARSLGQTDLATKVEERLRWFQIRYRGHKEYSFSVPIDWLNELSRVEPACWKNLGLKLWVLAEACSAQGGDNRMAWQLGEALGAAAWACGPVDVWQLLTAEYFDCGSDSWFFPTANRIVGGLTKRLRRDPPMTIQDKLAAWCLAVGFSRWFHDDSVKSLAELRAVLIDTAAVSEAEKAQIKAELERITPGEARRNPRPENIGTATSSGESEQKDLATWIRLIEEGAEVDPYTAARLLRELHAKPGDSFNELAARILGAVGVGGAYSWASYSYGNYDALFEIARVASDDLLWHVVRAALKYSGGGYWSQGLSETLQHLLLARAKVTGSTSLRKGLDCTLRMHEKWARGGRGDLALPTIRLGEARPLKSNAELAAYGLSFLLASRSAEIIESVLVGIHALASHQPEVVATFLDLADGDSWRQHWVLNSAEAWAALFPSELENARIWLESCLESGPLHLRLQCWIVLRKLAQSRGSNPPGFPFPVANQTTVESNVQQPPRQILSSPPEKRGAFNLVNRFSSAESTIERVQEATGANLETVRSEVAAKLMESPAPDTNEGHWMERVYCRGDTQITARRSESVLDEAFDNLLRHSAIPARLQVRFAQAYLTGEDPWIARFSPLPDDDPGAWPSEGEIGGTGKKPPDLAGVRRKLFLLTSQHRVPSDEIVIAGKAQVFTWREDFVFRLWWGEGAEDTKEVSAHHCPTTLNGRTFVVVLGDWWEPKLPAGRRPFAFGVGAQNKLSLCFPEFFPARLWLREFGWTPSPDNPLVWLDRGQPVARYERIHGEPRSTRSGHPRQPLLGRWLVKKSSWEKLSVDHGPFSMFDDFERFSSDVEH